MSRLLAVLLGALPVVANAQGYEGAVADLRYLHYDFDNGSDLESLGGTLDATWQFGRLGVQTGLFIGKDIDSSDDIDLGQNSAIALHLSTDVSEELRLGALVAAADDSGGIYLYAAEALYLSGPIRVEGRLGDSFDNSNPNRMFELTGAYGIGNALSVRAGLNHEDFETAGYYTTMSVGAGFKVSDQSEVYADVKRFTDNYGDGFEYKGNTFSLGVRFNLGGDSSKAFRYMPLN